jgi:hypothetical protein
MYVKISLGRPRQKWDDVRLYVEVNRPWKYEMHSGKNRNTTALPAGGKSQPGCRVS